MGGYSYQDIESRLKTVEEKLEFVMAAVRQPVTTGVVGLDGKPKIVMLTLTEIFPLYRQAVLAPALAVPKEESAIVAP